MQTVQKQPFYTSITGDKIIIHADEITHCYTRDQLEYIVNDPLTLEIMKNPIIVGDNIYDMSSISELFIKTDKDPLNGKPIIDLNITKYKILKYVLLCLEETADGFLFHSNMINLLSANLIGELSYGDVKIHENFYDEKSRFRMCYSCAVPDSVVVAASNLFSTDDSTKIKVWLKQNSIRGESGGGVSDNETKDAPIDVSIRGIMKSLDGEKLVNVEFRDEDFALCDFTNMRENKSVRFVRCNFISCILPSKEQLVDCKYDMFDEKLRYKLEDLLFMCHITGKHLHVGECLLIDGYLVASDANKGRAVNYKCKTYDEHLSRLFDKKTVRSKIPQRLYDQINCKPGTYNVNTDGFYLRLSLLKNPAEMEVGTNEALIYFRMLKLRHEHLGIDAATGALSTTTASNNTSNTSGTSNSNTSNTSSTSDKDESTDARKGTSCGDTCANVNTFMNTGSHSTMMKAIVSMSSQIDTYTINASESDYSLMLMRRFLRIPFLVHQEMNIYGRDFSLMYIENKEINKGEFRDYYFTGGYITGVTFNECTFDECCFAGTTFTNVRFNSCRFLKKTRRFYNSVNKGVNLRKCVAEGKAYDYILELINRTPSSNELRRGEGDVVGSSFPSVGDPVSRLRMMVGDAKSGGVSVGAGVGVGTYGYVGRGTLSAGSAGGMTVMKRSSDVADESPSYVPMGLKNVVHPDDFDIHVNNSNNGRLMERTREEVGDEMEEEEQVEVDDDYEDKLLKIALSNSILDFQHSNSSQSSVQSVGSGSVSPVD